jgi:hypothetical protein
MAKILCSTTVEWVEITIVLILSRMPSPSALKAPFITSYSAPCQKTLMCPGTYNCVHTNTNTRTRRIHSTTVVQAQARMHVCIYTYKCLHTRIGAYIHTHGRVRTHSTHTHIPDNRNARRQPQIHSEEACGAKTRAPTPTQSENPLLLSGLWTWNDSTQEPLWGST